MADTVGQSGPLPSMSYLDMEKIKRENAIYGHSIPATSALNMPAPPLVSPSTVYSGPPPPYSYPSSAASSVVGGGAAAAGPNGYISPPDTRRTSDDNKEPPSLRSLPSIHEALNTGEQPVQLSISSLLSSTAPQQKISLVSKSPTSPVSRSFLDAPRGPPDSFPHQFPSNYRSYESSDRSNRPTYSPRMATTHSETRFPAISSHDFPSFQISRTASSPSNYSRPGPCTMQPSLPTSPLHDTVPPSAPPTNAPFGYSHYQPAYSFPPSTPSISSYKTPILQQPKWRSNGTELNRVDEPRKTASKESSPPRTAYAESVKRHLDIFDLEASLNEVADGSGRALDFCKHYGTRAHQTQRSGPIPGSLPSLDQCDEMIREQTKVLESMSRIRDVIFKQQQALAEQRNYDRQNYKAAPSEADEESNSYMDKLEGSGGFAGADAKKRRGRAAPPGRCHSCNRAETPEWRRGPDGARTLCNACGLHYAKLTRKMGSKTSSGPSNLRPKESSPSSP